MIKEIRTVLKEFNPGNGQLRGFGIVLGVIAGILYFSHEKNALLLIIALGALALALAAPRLYLPFVKILIAITYPIGWVFSRVLLIIFFYVVLTPLGLIRRLFVGRIQKKDSHWQPVEQNEHHDRMSL